MHKPLEMISTQQRGRLEEHTHALWMWPFQTGGSRQLTVSRAGEVPSSSVREAVGCGFSIARDDKRGLLCDDQELLSFVQQACSFISC